MTADLRRANVLAFRAGGHGLARRRPRAELVAAAAAIGLRRTRHTALALAARVEGAGAEDLDRALHDEDLVVVFGTRGTRMVVPVADVDVFTRGAAPADEASLRAAVPGAFLRRLDDAGVTATDALAQVVDAVRDALSDGPRSRGETAMAVTRTLPGPLSPPCRGRCPDPHVEDSLFRLAGVQGAMRFLGDTDDLVALAEPTLPVDEARGELVRRHLRCYGPATPATLAEWMGVSTADAGRSLRGTPVTVEGRAAGVLHSDDVERAMEADCRGVRILPPYDAWLLDRDRATLVPDAGARRMLWRSSGNPGVVLVDGRPAAAWRGRLRLDPLPGGPAVDPAALRDEARKVGLA